MGCCSGRVAMPGSARSGGEGEIDGVETNGTCSNLGVGGVCEG